MMMTTTSLFIWSIQNDKARYLICAHGRAIHPLFGSKPHVYSRSFMAKKVLKPLRRWWTSTKPGLDRLIGWCQTLDWGTFTVKHLTQESLGCSIIYKLAVVVTEDYRALNSLPIRFFIFSSPPPLSVPLSHLLYWNPYSIQSEQRIRERVG